MVVFPGGGIKACLFGRQFTPGVGGFNLNLLYPDPPEKSEVIVLPHFKVIQNPSPSFYSYTSKQI